MLAVVASLRDQQRAEPRAEFATDLRSRLMAEAETVLRPEAGNLLLPVRDRGRRERRLVAAASAFVLIGGTTTMAAAAQGSLPGEALYPIKRGIEQAQVGLSLSPAGKGEDLLSQASDRLTEVEGLLGSGTVQAEPRVPATLEAFSASAREGSDLMFEAFRETSDPENIVSVRTFTAEGVRTLESLADSVPAEAKDELAAAALLLREIDAEAAALCGSCAADLPLIELPGIFLAHAEVDRALALAARNELMNSHPVVVSKDVVDAAAEAAGSDSGDSEPDAPAGPSDPTPTVLPSPSWEPTAWPSILPDLGGANTGSKTEDSTSAEKTVKDLSNTLNGVVETLLPDSDGLLD
jgi:hypothetical protein